MDWSSDSRAEASAIAGWRLNAQDEESRLMEMRGHSSSGAGRRTADAVVAAHRSHASRGEYSQDMDRTRGVADPSSGPREEWPLAGCAPPHLIHTPNSESHQESWLRPTRRQHQTQTPAIRSGKSTATTQHCKWSHSDFHLSHSQHCWAPA